MKFLHTSDWHLGQKFQHHDRIAEHQAALDWLLATILKEKVDVLLIAGDIFDIGNPPNYARKMYYQFLTKLLGSCCRHIVITGGNHDSPAMLQAPKDLLEALNIHVIGTTGASVEQEIVELYDPSGKMEAVIAAVPFLRDKDLRFSVSGETSMERVQAIRKGIKDHFEAVGEAISAYEDLTIPLIAMGHLYVEGVITEAKKERANIYIGDEKNINPTDFPPIFDYVALGHIHRAQAFGNVHYSGSLIPLSFSETKDEKVVKLVDFEGEVPAVTPIAVPLSRRLKTIERPLEAIENALINLSEKYQDYLPTWVDVLLTDERPVPGVDALIRSYCKDLNLEVLKIRTNFQFEQLQLSSNLESLEDLQPIDVFQRKCNIEGYDPAETEELLLTFRELEEWMQANLSIG